MEATKQRIKVATAHQKEEKKAKEELASSSAPKVVTKGSVKMKHDGKDNPPLKKVAVTLEDVPLKKSPPSQVAVQGRG